jgi:predicted nucleotidyltransferase
MYRAQASPASGTTLDEVVQQLATQRDVAGAAIGGSAKDTPPTDASDIDLLIVVGEEWSNLRVGVTWIEGRLGDLLFATTGEIDTIASADPPVPPDTWVGRIASFVADARIVIDYGGQLATARRAARQWPETAQAPRGSDAYRAWHKINYDRQHSRRMLASDDPDYGTALDVRLLYGLDDVLTGYFAIRRLRWEGEKAAVRYLRERDPAFLALFRRCMAEQNHAAKFALYDHLCQEATAPVGGVWRDEPTSAHLRDPESATPEAHAEATAFVQSLVIGD